MYKIIEKVSLKININIKLIKTYNVIKKVKRYYRKLFERHPTT